jgi:isoamylase
VQILIAHRLRFVGESSEEIFGLSLNELLRRAEIDWHGVRLGQPDWSDDSHSIACTIRPNARSLPIWLHVMFNAYWEALDFDLPDVPETTVSGWQRWIDTAQESPEDITDRPSAPLVGGTQYRVMPRSVAVLLLRIAAPSSIPA